MAEDRGGILFKFLVWSFVIFSFNVSFGSCEIEEVAGRRKNYATQIGTYDDNTADRALDGDINPDNNAGHCAQPHDASGQNAAWWMADLGSEYAIYNVTIYSEDSTSNEKTLGYISVRVSDSADISDHTVTYQCALWNKNTFPKKSHETLVCDQVMHGRYVSIQRTGGENPHNMILCEVKIMGERTYDTICANCNDVPCEQTAPCSECLGYTEPECREVCNSNKYGINCQQDCSSHCQTECDSKTGHCECDPGYYGDKCDQRCNRHCKDDICDKDTGACECESGYYGDDCDPCSEGCEDDTCNSDSGRCNCKDWWDGIKCDTEVGVYEIPRKSVTFTDETDSSAVVTWRTIRDLPDNMKQYYSYVLEYRVDGESEWTVVDSLDHEPEADDTQQYTLTGLQYNTGYKVQVRSVRSLRDLTETTQDTPDATLTTKCIAPEKPTQMNCSHEQDGEKVTLTVTWKAPDPGCTEITDNDIEYRLSSAGDDDWQSEDLRSSATSAEIRDLDPGEYVVRVIVTNDGGLKSSETITYPAGIDTNSLSIPTDAPLTTEGVSRVTIRWKTIPNVPAELGDNYQYAIEYKNETSSIWLEWRTRQSHAPSPDQYQEATLTDLNYNTDYNVRVKSYSLFDGQTSQTGVTDQKSFRTKCKAPSEPRNVAVTSEENGVQVNLTVTWEHPEVIGCNSLSGYEVMYRLQSASDDAWTTAATLPATARSHTLQLNNTGYYVVRVEVTNDGDSSGNSNSGEVSYKRESDPGGKGNEGVIAGVVVGVLILVALLVILAFLLYRRRQPSCVFDRKKVRSRDIVLASHLELPVKELSETDSYEEMEEASPPSTKKKPRLPVSINSLASRIGKLRPRNAETVESSKPVILEKPEMTTTIPDDGEDVDAVTPAAVQIGDTRIRLGSLATYIKDKKSEKDGFKNEYCVLKKDLQYPCVEGEKDDHRLQKNRYRNIIAYDHSRVVLDLLDGDPNSSYVNACYISGYNDAPKEYIASQGPRTETVDDFWRMVWLLNSNCIVMVTMLVENTKEKCAQYWPTKDGKSHQYADIKVETRQEEHFADYIVRIFAIEKEGETRTIQQFHFTSWVDRSTPEHIFPLLHFRRKVMAFREQRTGPLVVHCSAGVGRTGTFIAIDYLDKEAEAEDHVDVRSCVAKMRTQRPNMVQTLPQYVFVYESLLELFEIGNTAIPCDQLEEKYRFLCNDSGEYANTSKLQEQFELLNQQRIVPDDDKMAAVTAENKSKNRCRNILPSDRYRPYLSSWHGQSDYINAVYIDSYRKRDMYIVTQTPMPETLTDFWRLVFEHNCNTIIMMENVDDSDQTVATYWPELVGTKQENGPLTIELLGEDTSGKPGLVTREFNVAPTKKAKKAPSKVKQFQLTAWEGDDQLTTNLQKEILNLIEKVEAWQAQASKGPVLVHCVNGASRSGLFCAANYLIDMIKTEQEVDVFYVVRHIRAHRPQLVDSLEQYQFLHELALTYMTQYATYANYTGGN